jgi:hypothetical protein
MSESVYRSPFNVYQDALRLAPSGQSKTGSFGRGFFTVVVAIVAGIGPTLLRSVSGRAVIQTSLSGQCPP